MVFFFVFLKTIPLCSTSKRKSSERASFVNIYEACNYARSAEFHLARINITTPASKLEFYARVSRIDTIAPILYRLISHKKQKIRFLLRQNLQNLLCWLYTLYIFANQSFLGSNIVFVKTARHFQNERFRDHAQEFCHVKSLEKLKSVFVKVERLKKFVCVLSHLTSF